MGKSQDLYKKAKTLIPGGTQLLSKRPEMFLPDLWPAYYKKAKGCEIWDLDGNKYLDFTSMGIGTSILGYCDEDVNMVVKSVIDNGSMTTLNAPEEVELAEKLIELHPWADMVRYTRSGGEAMTVAVRIARAASGKDKVLFCGYHGWHDWYLSANLSDDVALDEHLLPGLEPKGVPRNLQGTSIPFLYNDTVGFLSLLEKHKNEVGVVVLETVRNDIPNKDFIETIRIKTKELGIVLVLDEITCGWRICVGGAHLKLGFDPDIAVYGKAMSNGYPMAAIVGKKEVMEAAQGSFISSTYWTDRIGPSASIVTINKMIKDNVQEHLVKTGEKIQKGWQKCADNNGIKIHIHGISPLSHFSFVCDKPLVAKTLFTQIMLEKGFLASTVFYASFAHEDRFVEMYLNATNEVFSFIFKNLDNLEKYLKGPVCHAGFKRLN